MSNLAVKLKNSAKYIWKVQNVISGKGLSSVEKFKTLTIGGSLLQFFSLLPPVVVGIYVLFSAFWPKRINFFNSSHRRRFMNDKLSYWSKILIILIFALLINTALVNELKNILNKSFPLIDVHVHKKFGWKVSILASSFSLAASLSYIIVFLTLKIKTHEDLGNLTNEGREYQIDYQRDGVTRWNWFLPITLFHSMWVWRYG